MIRHAFVALLALTSFSAVSQDTANFAPILQAADVAIHDYKKRLSREPTDWEYGYYVSDIRNYSIGLSESRDAYVVVIDLKDIPGHEPFFGGRGDYFIDKMTLKISRFEGHK